MAEHTLHQWIWDITNSGSGVYLSTIPPFTRMAVCEKNNKFVSMHYLPICISDKKGTNYITTQNMVFKTNLVYATHCHSK
jgi:hypothetical protein